MQKLKYVVRWSDRDGSDKSKEYDDEKSARKAKEWLLNNGSSSVDIAVSLGGKNIPMHTEAKKELNAPQQQPWWDK